MKPFYVYVYNKANDDENEIKNKRPNNKYNNNNKIIFFGVKNVQIFWFSPRQIKLLVQIWRSFFTLIFLH